MGAAGAGSNVILYGSGTAAYNGTGIANSSPVMVASSPDGFLNANSCKDSMFLIHSDNTLWTWGTGTNGKMGLGNTTNYTSPVQVGALTDWASMASHLYQTMHAIKTDGTLWGWGKNNYGSLGDGTKIVRSSPVQIGALTDWANCAGSNSNSVAVKTNGTLWTWGREVYGANGDYPTTTVPRSSPVQIGALTTWVKGFSNHTLSNGAIQSNGTLWTWGWGYGGSSGTGVNQPKNGVPTQVGARTDWVDIATSSQSVMGVTSAGKLYGWGRASAGALGLGNTTDYSSPVQVGSLTDWASISGFAMRSAFQAVKTDGTLWRWGSGNGGTLGLGNTTSYSSPVQVGSSTNWLTPAEGGVGSSSGYAGFGITG
tara:strand:- start:52 stop:1158 length:1107 start_codon:yes stop_codon:yes gene_type:complete